MRPRILICMLAMTGVYAQEAQAQAYPDRPIRLISPFAPGGGNDILSRTLAQAMAQSLGQPVVVDNRAGANTIVGIEIASKAAPDGYTLVMASSSLASNATLYATLPYDSVRDFAPVSLVASTPLILAVYPALPAATVRELIALARAKPGQISYPSAGTGNSSHLAAELFASMAGVSLLHVPYKGSSPGITDLMAGRLSFIITTALAVVPHIKSGRLRALAVTTSTRSAVMSELPTVAESGLPGYEASSWYGVLAPARTPRPIVMRLNAEIVKAIAVPDVKERLTSQGLDPIGSMPDQFAAYLRAEIVKWAKVIKATGARAE